MDDNTIVWKSIEGFDSYEVSNEGNIRNRVTNKILKRNIDTHGYCQVALYKNGIKYTLLLHRVVALAFIDNPNDYTEIDHKNRIKTDNNVVNLEWSNRSKNMTNTNHRNGPMFGIRRRKDRNTFRVCLPINGVTKYIGSCRTLEEAKMLRDKIMKTDCISLNNQNIPQKCQT